MDLQEEYKKESGFDVWTEAELDNQYYDNDYVEWLEAKIKAMSSCTKLPTKDEVILEGEKQIEDWLKENIESEKLAFRIGFRRSFEYVLKLMGK